MKILIIGDSQGAGPPGNALARSLRGAGNDVRRIAYEGHGAYDWVRLHWAEYTDALRSLNPDKVIMVFGSNDLASERLLSAMQRFRASAPSVFYAGPPQYLNESRQRSSALIRAMAGSVFGSKHLDAWPYTGSDAERRPDGVHFTAAGGAKWGRAIVGQMVDSASEVVSSQWVAPLLTGAAALAAIGAWWWRKR
ncbi:MAG: hypothetical protein DRH30_13505 [Deltaproteobacteria bacterium]|nr:MAG: hypothetical protein DRH30_13505 [Deltaproteobacteria bacterium]